jgi:PAS domain S-box-containing protein
MRLATLNAAFAQAPRPGIANAGNTATMRPLKSGGISIPKTLFRAALYAVLYFVMMVLSVVVTRYGGVVSPIWIASGVMSWGLVSSPTRDWPLLIGFTAAAHIAGAAVVGDQWQIEIVYLIANMASPILFAALMRWRQDDLEFDERGAVIRFLLCALAAAAASILVVAGAEWIQGHPYSVADNVTWFLSDALGIIVFVPIIMTIARGDWRELVEPRLRARALLMFAVLIAGLAVAWILPAVGYRIFTILLVIYLIYLAFDLGLTGARAGVAIASVGIVIYTLFAPAPPDRLTEPRDFVLTMQVYLAALFVCVMPLAAALAEKQRLYEDASNALGDAQEAWGELLAAEAHYRLIADNADDMIARLGFDGSILFASPAWRAMATNLNDLAGAKLADLTHPDDRDRVCAEIAKVVGERMRDRPHLLQLRLRDMNGVWRLFDLRLTLVAPGGGAAGELVAVLRQAQE